MKIWIDNTGLQSAAQCLNGTADRDHEYDVRGIIQLATLLIFANRLELNGFEDKRIAKRSREVVHRLQALGIGNDILSIRSIGEPEYALACKTAANSIADELCDSFNPEEFKLLGGEPPDLPRGTRERLVNCIAIAKEKNGSAILRRVEDEALRDKAVGAVDYMLACSADLREAVRRAIKVYPNWTDFHSYQLNIFLRYHLNDALGEQAFSTYAPAVARAELVQRRNDYVIKALQSVMEKAVESIRGEPLGIPSTLAALLNRSKGEPEALLKVALEFRSRSGPLRDYLETFASKHNTDTPESRYEIQQAVRELGGQLRRDLGLEKAVKGRDAVEVRLIYGLPIVSISGTKLLDWFEERRRKRRTAVLTELIKSSAYSDLSSIQFEKLRKYARRKNV